MDWSKYQQAVFDFVAQRPRESAIVEAVAGSGKTTTIVAACAHLTGTAYLAAFNKRMGEELRARITGQPRLGAGTFHSVGFRALTHAAPGGRVRVEGGKVRDLWEAYCEDRGWDQGYQLTPIVTRLVSAAKSSATGIVQPVEHVEHWRGLIEHYGLMEECPEGTTEDQVVAYGQLLLARSVADTSCVDFDDMLYLPLLNSLRLQKFDHVFIDEAQDTNLVRLLTARAMLKPGGRVIAVGDPRQAIYGFSGASATALDSIADMFSADRLPLSVSYRCAQRVVQHAQQWSAQIEAWEGAPEGSVESGDLRDLLKKWHPARGEALLCRFNRPLMRLAFALIRAGLPARIEGREIGEGLVALTKRWPVQTLEALEQKLDEWEQAEVRKLLVKKNSQAKQQMIHDRAETLRVLIERASALQTDVAGLQALIREMFQDSVGADQRIFTLSSVHKSKGLEWPRVFVLGRGEVMPSPYATQPWELEQEGNLCYVATTRAKRQLVELSGVKEEVEA